MSMVGDQNSEPPSRETNAVNFNSTHSVSKELDSLLNAVDSESIADELDIGKHSKTHEFDNHLTVAVREGLDLDSSTSLAELADKTETDEQFQAMAASTFSRDTTDRAVVAVGRFLVALLHTPQLSHQRAVHRNRLEWITRGVVAVNEINLQLTRSVAVSDEFVGDDEQSYKIDTEDGGLDTGPHAWTVNTSIRLVQLSQKATLTKVRSVTISKMMSISSQTSAQLSGCSNCSLR